MLPKIYRLDPDTSKPSVDGRVTFFIQGSANEPYTTTFTIRGNNLTAHCTCPAGQVRQYCKHRFGILQGETKGIVSGNEQQAAIVQSWLPGTDVEMALKDLAEAEDVYNREVKKLKATLSGYKKKLARALMD